MKKRRWLRVLPVLCLSLLCGCAASGEERTPPIVQQGEEQLQTTAETDMPAPETKGANDIAVFYGGYDDVYLTALSGALEAELHLAGLEAGVYEAQGDFTKQLEQMDQAIAGGAGILIVDMAAVADAGQTYEILTRANGLPVIFFGQEIEGADEQGSVLHQNMNVCYVGPDDAAFPQMLAEMVADDAISLFSDLDLNEDGQLSYEYFCTDENGAQDALERIDRKLAEASLAPLYYCDQTTEVPYRWDAGGMTNAEFANVYMSAHMTWAGTENENMIELVICDSDIMAEGAIEALAGAGYNTGEEGSVTIPVYGAGGTDGAKDRIDIGQMAGTVTRDAAGQAHAIAQIAAALRQGGEEGIPEILASLAGAEDAGGLRLADGFVNKLLVAPVPYRGGGESP
ncbi:MAG: substrate-binding domain-containing protein [Lachnospiraceae bacterium]|nr:substrate-binding domain-containing protein [Lachnospiraceae bacterium]